MIRTGEDELDAVCVGWRWGHDIYSASVFAFGAFDEEMGEGGVLYDAIRDFFELRAGVEVEVEGRGRGGGGETE